LTIAEDKKESFKHKKQIAYKYFGGRCFVCHVNFKKGFLFHHLWYNPNEKYYADFGGDSVAYNEYLIPLIEKNPSQFLLLCKKHHHAVEALKKFSPDKLVRLIDAAMMSGRPTKESINTSKKKVKS
jgi:hypothetical protein